MSTTAVNLSNPALDQNDLEIPSGSAYEEWRKTGKLPESEADAAKLEAEVQTEEKKEEAERLKTEPSKAEESATSEAAASVTPAASEPARPQKKDANARIRELNAELKKSRERYEQLVERFAAPVQPSVRQESRPAETSKAAETAKMPSEQDKDESGQLKYKTYGELQNAQLQWAIAEGKRQALDEFGKQQAVTTREREQQEANRPIVERWNKQVADAKKSHSDFEAVVFNPKVPLTGWAEMKDGKLAFTSVAGTSPVDQYIMASPMGAEVAYYLGQHPEEVTAMNGIKLDPTETNWIYTGSRMSASEINRRLALIELSLMPDEEEQPQSKPPASAKPVTQAPPPPRQVAGRAPSTADPLSRAVEDEDQDAYMREANARDLARRKAHNGRRG